VARAFQAAAERASGAFTSFTFVHHSPVERQRFLDKFVGHRFRFLRRVKVCTVFPPINRFTPISCRETIDELRDKDEDFTRQIRDVCTSIRLVEAAHNDIVGKLQIRIYAPIRFVEEDVCDHNRYSSWRVHLLAPQELPKLESVRALSVCDMADEDLEVGACRSKLDLRVMIDLAARCSNLGYLGCKLGADEWMCNADPY
jgi:hypothetical protein